MLELCDCLDEFFSVYFSVTQLGKASNLKHVTDGKERKGKRKYSDKRRNVPSYPRVNFSPADDLLLLQSHQLADLHRELDAAVGDQGVVLDRVNFALKRHLCDWLERHLSRFGTEIALAREVDSINRLNKCSFLHIDHDQTRVHRSVEVLVLFSSCQLH
jgi:hypothetical protein